MFLAYWVDQLNPFIVRFSGNFGIRYYGVAYLMGFVAGFLLLRAYAKARRSLVSAEQVPDLIIAIVVGVLVGGRLGSYLLYDGWESFHADPLGIFKVWDGGMASHGGFIGVALALVWFARSRRIPFLHLSDLIVSVAPLGLFFGRVANFINGELWGKISHVSWAVIFPLSAAPGTPIADIAPRHPSQLYEAGLEGLFLFALMQWRFWRTDITRARPGRLAGEFLIAYAAVRALGEIFREPDAGISLILGLSRGTFYSIFLVAAGLVLILKKSRPLPENPAA